MKLNNEFDYSMLSSREKTVLSLIGSGCSNKEIAFILHISEGTVKGHIKNIMNKTRIRDRLQLALEYLSAVQK